MERHPLRLSYLVTGIVFITVAVLGLADAWQFPAAELAWAGPGLLVVLGIALVVGTAVRREDDAVERSTTDPEPSAADEAVEESAPSS